MTLVTGVIYIQADFCRVAGIRKCQKLFQIHAPSLDNLDEVLQEDPDMIGTFSTKANVWQVLDLTVPPFSSLQNLLVSLILLQLQV